MDAETAMAFAFLLLGLGFFMLMTRVLLRDHRESHEQRVAETREFGAPVEDRKKSRRAFSKD